MTVAWGRCKITCTILSSLVKNYSCHLKNVAISVILLEISLPAGRHHLLPFWGRELAGGARITGWYVMAMVEKGNIVLDVETCHICWCRITSMEVVLFKMDILHTSSSAPQSFIFILLFFPTFCLTHTFPKQISQSVKIIIFHYIYLWLE